MAGAHEAGGEAGTAGALATRTLGHAGGLRLVLVHGFTQTMASWAPLLPALAERFELVLVDAPGHGGSVGVPADMGAAAAALGQAGGRAAYVGYSMGGRMCLRLAVDRPDLVQALVLIGASPGLADPVERAALREAIDHPNTDPARGSTLPPPFWESLRLSDTGAPADAAWIGRSILDIATVTGRHPADALFDLALADDLDAVFHWSNETPAWRELLRDVQKHPQMIVGVSDGGAHLDRDDGQEWSTHFLATWWRAERVWRLEEAIRLMTAVPAAILGITDRGLLAPGLPADVFLFDPERIDVGTCRLETDAVIGSPRFRGVPVGIVATIVNGVVVVEDGVRADARPGEVVRPR
jgi:N-acyl-D-aspartate/D-glutamate deacylase